MAKGHRARAKAQADRAHQNEQITQLALFPHHCLRPFEDHQQAAAKQQQDAYPLLQTKALS